MPNNPAVPTEPMVDEFSRFAASLPSDVGDRCAGLVNPDGPETDRTQDERFCSHHIKARSVIHLQAENEALIADRDAMTAALKMVLREGVTAKTRDKAWEALAKHGGRS